MDNPGLLLAIALVASVALVAVFEPKRGALSALRRARQLAERASIEDMLKYVLKRELNGNLPSIDAVAGGLGLSRRRVMELIELIRSDGLVEVVGRDLKLTGKGRGEALHIVRAHRLWEHFLAERTGFPESEWHELADAREHAISRAEADALAAELGQPAYDPHGDPIPTASGALATHEGRALSEFRAGTEVIAVHLEDEPPEVYAQLLAEGFYPGIRMRLVEATAERIEIWAGGELHVLAPVVAANVSVRPVPAAALDEEPNGRNLADLRPGQTAEVSRLSRRIRGAERRRMMDLGILPGTTISAELLGPGGGPTAYRIRGALIALRKEQAELIQVGEAN